MVSHYLLFDRNCSDALETYVKAFGAQIIEMRKYGDVPNPEFPINENDKDIILHSRLKLDNMEIMCADSTEHSQSGKNMYISLTTNNAALIKQAWEILKLNGEIYMELVPTFFADLHGSLQDKFGINWMFSAMKAF